MSRIPLGFPVLIALAVSLACAHRKYVNDFPVADATQVSDEVANRYRDAACDEHASDDEVARSCGPFPCSGKKCVVEACESGSRCIDGGCEGGWCRRLAASRGHACPTPARLERQGSPDIAALSGCKCRPEFGGQWSRSADCDSLPCTAQGCYVMKCVRDEDCAFGLCASHGGGPSGYCVTDDPY